MKHLKIYEDFGFDRPRKHKDDDLFDYMINQLGTNLSTTRTDPNDKNYWTRHTDKRSDGFHIVWKNHEPLTSEELDWLGNLKKFDHHFEVEKVSKEIKNILDRPEPDKYNCWIDSADNTLDVSEEKIKKFFNKLEEIENKDTIYDREEYKKGNKTSVLNALKNREIEIIKKDAKKYNL